MRLFWVSAIIALTVGISGCAPLYPATPSSNSAAFAERFPKNLQGMIILKPEDAGVALDYSGSTWNGPAGSRMISIEHSRKAPYVLMMLPPGEYTLERLSNYGYWMDINKAVVVVNEGTFIGKPAFEVTAGKVTYLGDIKAGSSPIKDSGGLFGKKKMITAIHIEDNYDHAANYLKEDFPMLEPYLHSGLIAATGDVIELEAAQ